MTEKKTEKPEIVDKQEYGSYFARLVESLVARKQGPFTHKQIVITAGPWRSYAVAFRSDAEAGVLYLDFYSAIRSGFGQLSAQDKTELVELL